MASGTSLAKNSRSVDVADEVIDSITERFYLLAIYPHLGRRRDHDLRAGLRTFPAGEYVIVYCTTGEDVSILHVIRGSRNIRALLRD